MHPHRCIYRDKPAPYRLAFLLFLFRFQTLRASAIKALRQAVSEAPKTYASRTAEDVRKPHRRHAVDKLCGREAVFGSISDEAAHLRTRMHAKRAPVVRNDKAHRLSRSARHPSRAVSGRAGS